MNAQPGEPAEEIKRLQRCINDLVSVLALPAMWSGAAPSQIVQTLLDALFGMLGLDLVYVRLKETAGQPPAEMARFSPSLEEIAQSRKIGDLTRDWLGADPEQWPSLIRKPVGDRELSIVSMGLGLHGEIGLIIAGSERADFPLQTERLVLNVAVNQAAIGLQQTRLLNEQKRVAHELDERVAQRTRELAATNEELQLQAGLLQRLPVSAWTLKPDGTPDFVNQVWLEFSGQTLDFVRSHPEAWMTAVHPEDREAASKAFWQGINSGQGFAVETRSLRARDGAYRWHLNQAVVFRDADGKVLKFVGTTTDIDDQKRAQEKLRESEYESRLIVDTIPAQISVAGPNGGLVRANQRVLDYFGRSMDEFSQWATDDTIHPDDRPSYVDAITHSLTTGDPTEIEVRTRRFDGVYRWFQIRGLPLRDDQGQILRWYFLQTDIDDRKHAEEVLRSSEEQHRVVVETASDAVISMDEAGAIRFANPATARIFGYDPIDIVGKPLTVLMPEFMRQLHQNGFRRYLATGQRHINWQGTELTALRRNGQEFPVEVSFGEMTSDGHKMFTGFIRDISEKKQAEVALRSSQAQLSRATRIATVGEFAAAIAHEINQPLAAVVANGHACLRWLSNDPPGLDKALEAAERIVRDGKEAGEVVRRIRALFKQAPLETSNLDLNEVIREVLRLLAGEASKKQVTVEMDLRDGLATVEGDRVQLQQLIFNLALNGIEAMDPVLDRPKKLFIRSKPLDPETVQVEIQDSGVGIEDAEKVFEAFFTTKENGMGMGLAVCRSIVDAHRGRLWAESGKGAGTTFSFTLPVQSGTA